MAEGRLWHAIACGLCMLALLVVALRQTRRVKTYEDFALAGRNLPLLLLVATLIGTWVGTGAIFDLAQEAYRRGIDAFLLPLASSAGLVFLWFTASRTRRLGASTMQDVLEARFGPVTRVLGAVALIGAYLMLVASQYRAGGAILGYIFPWLEGGTAMAVVAVFVIVFTTAAGLYSVAATDLICVALVVAGLLFALPILLSQSGGYDAAIASLPTSSQEITYGGGKLLGLFLPGLLVVIADANLFQRVSAARTPQAAKVSLVWMLGGVLALQLALVLMSILAAALVAQGGLPHPAPREEHHLLLQAAFDALPLWLGPLVVAGFFSLIVSSADSFLLTPVTVFVHDLYRRFLRPDLRADKYLFFSRASVIFAGLSALAIASLTDEIFSQALFACSVYGAAIAPVLLAAYFWPRATARGATSAMIGGIVVTLLSGWLTTTSVQDALYQSGWVVLTDFGQWATRAGIDPILPGFLAGALLLVGVSLAGAPPEEKQANALQQALADDEASQPPSAVPADTSKT